MGSWQAPEQLWVLGDCLLHSQGPPGPRAGRWGGVGIIGLHAQGTLLLLAEPQTEFEMSNREPSCLYCERQGLAGRFPPCQALWTGGGGRGDSPKPAPGVTGKPFPLPVLGGQGRGG